MAACDLTSLIADACSNEFYRVAQNESLSRGIILQLFYNASGGSETEEELIEQACSNGFYEVAQNESLFRSTLLQLLCNLN